MDPGTRASGGRSPAMRPGQCHSMRGTGRTLRGAAAAALGEPTSRLGLRKGPGERKSQHDATSSHIERRGRPGSSLAPGGGDCVPVPVRICPGTGTGPSMMRTQDKKTSDSESTLVSFLVLFVDEVQKAGLSGLFRPKKCNNRIGPGAGRRPEQRVNYQHLLSTERREGGPIPLQRP